MNDTNTLPQFTIGQKLGLALGMPLLMLCALELLARAVSLINLLQPKSKEMQLEMPTWMMNERTSREKAARYSGDASTIDWLNIFQEGPGFRVRLIPNIEKEVSNTFSQIPADRAERYLVKANSLGFRGSEAPPLKAAGVFRVVVFGDSSSFGWGVNQDETYSEVLRRSLQDRAPGKKIEVLNFAIPGDSSEYGKLIFDRYAKEHQPDLVILGFGANDAKMVFQSHSSQVDLFRSRYGLQVVSFWARKSALFSSLELLMKSAISKPAAAPSTAPVAPTHKVHAVRKTRYRDNLAHMAEAAREAGAKQAIILALCTPGNYAKAAADMAENRNLLFLNGQSYLMKLLPSIQGGSVYPELVAEMRSKYPAELERNSLYYLTSDACHPNKLGHRLVGERLGEIVAGAGLL